MMEKGRIKNTIRNVKTGFIVQLINKVMAFIVRTVFIKILNTEYLGVNGLFTNILTMLSFAELGIGTAIIFNMYKPVAEDDKEKIKSLMKLYKKSYNTIGIVVFLLGLIIIPFFDFLVKDIPNIKENIYMIYFLFLLNTSSSYFFTYKKSIISAYQQESIINKIDSIFYLLKSMFEIVFLVLTKNYIVYLIVQISGTILENIIIAHKANKMFPFLKDRKIKKLPKDETKNIFSNVKALVVYKLGTAILSGTDNILISILGNVSIVGLCSNYSMIIESIKGLILSALNGVTASVGNLNAVGSIEKKEKIFHQLTFVNFWIYAFFSISFIIFLNPFIGIWLGEEYILPQMIPFSLALSFFVCGIRTPAYTYRVTMGIFEKGKVTPFIAAISNIVFSIILERLMGISGIFFGTSLAQLVSYSWMDPYLIYKYKFNKSMKIYVKKMFKYFFVYFVAILITFFVTERIKIIGMLTFFLKAIVSTLLLNLIFIITFYKTEEFKELKKIIMNLFKRKNMEV